MKGEMSVASTRRPSSARTVTASGTAATSSLPSPGTYAHLYSLQVCHVFTRGAGMVSP